MPNGDTVPSDLQHVVEEAHRNPYEAFASAAVALAFRDEREREATVNLKEEADQDER